MERVLIRDLGEHVGKEVTIKGWVDIRRDHGKLIFVDIRDFTGLVQAVSVPSNEESHKIAETIRPEWVVEVIGVINERPEKMVNSDLQNGAIELKIEGIVVLNEAETPPFDVSGDGLDIGEEHRLKYRYLDLRRPRMQKNIRNRGKFVKKIRDYLEKKDFVEIETPLLTKSTPEGARDYVVPSRVEKGMFYALPQSPQQYKELLMTSGFERYFQIAKALRDEDTRGDRQPEHTQIDLEMSFTTPDEVMNIMEEMITKIVSEMYPSKKFKSPWPRISYQESIKKYKTDKPDLRENKDDPDEVAFAWVIDFPQFELNKEGEITPVHHMFVQPQDDSIELIEKDPLKMVSTQYDWVCNGYELASGSMRINDSELQMRIFKAIGMEENKARKDFGHLLEAFKRGTPPHGGIAPGLDRLMMILEGEPNIREVIAFPKTGEGKDLMMNAPSEISKEQLDELGIEIKKPKK